MKYYLDDKELLDLCDLKGKTLKHVSEKVGEFVIKNVDKENMRIQNDNNDKWYELKECFYYNFSMVEDTKPVMIYPLIENDEYHDDSDVKYCSSPNLNLKFLDYYVPYSHMTRNQVSDILGRDITQFSDYINNYRSENGRGYTLTCNLFNKAINEMNIIMKEKPVILVDLLGLFKGQEIEEDNLIFVDAKTKNKGHLIIKASDESVKKKKTADAKRILERKYILNEQLSEITEKNVTECYIFDDVYTKGNTINRIKELIIEHNDYIEPNFHIVTFAKTIRYKTNFLRFEDLVDNDKNNVLFVCNKNMTRSILAEAISRNEFVELNNKFNFYSVGIKDYAGREVCDHIYKYIIDNNLYDDSLKSQRLSHYYESSFGINEGEIIVDEDWLVLILDENIEDLVVEKYDLELDQYKVYDMPDVCQYTKPKKHYYENAGFLADKLREMIREVFDIE